jgi:hypothetical protein
VPWRCRIGARRGLWTGKSGAPAPNAATPTSGREAFAVSVLGYLRLSFWCCVAGTIVLYVFFVTVASIPLAEIAAVTGVVALLTAMFTIRNVRLNGELADRGGNPQLRRSINRQRERRGF